MSCRLQGNIHVPEVGPPPDESVLGTIGAASSRARRAVESFGAALRDELERAAVQAREPFIELQEAVHPLMPLDGGLQARIPSWHAPSIGKAMHDLRKAGFSPADVATLVASLYLVHEAGVVGRDEVRRAWAVLSRHHARFVMPEDEAMKPPPQLGGESRHRGARHKPAPARTIQFQPASAAPRAAGAQAAEVTSVTAELAGNGESLAEGRLVPWTAAEGCKTGTREESNAHGAAAPNGANGAEGGSEGLPRAAGAAAAEPKLLPQSHAQKAASGAAMPAPRPGLLPSAASEKLLCTMEVLPAAACQRMLLLLASPLVKPEQLDALFSGARGFLSLLSRSRPPPRAPHPPPAPCPCPLPLPPTRDHCPRPAGAWR